MTTQLSAPASSTFTSLLAGSAVAVACALLVACGGDDDTPAPVAVNGQFLDAAVQGLAYGVGAAAKTATDANGGYSCNVGPPTSPPWAATSRRATSPARP